jgi:hypothetical protein
MRYGDIPRTSLGSGVDRAASGHVLSSNSIDATLELELGRIYRPTADFLRIRSVASHDSSVGMKTPRHYIQLIDVSVRRVRTSIVSL